MTSRVRNKDKIVKQNIDTTLEPTEADEEILHMAYLNGAISYQFMIDEKGYTTKRFRRFKKLKHIKIHTEEVENPKTNKHILKFSQELWFCADMKPVSVMKSRNQHSSLRSATNPL